MRTALTLPDRARKPRDTGLTMMIDTGLPVRYFSDVVESHGHLVDLVKFGWGTAAVTPKLRDKAACLREAGIGYCFGGTFFEKHVAQDRVDDYLRLCDEYGCTHVEVSNGTVPLDEQRKAHYVSWLAKAFVVVSEVGAKTPEGDARLTPRDWARQIRTDLAHGAWRVIAEARESGTTGIATADGEARNDILDALADAGIDPDLLIFEAPTKRLQAHLVLRYGPNVNLGNIAPTDLVALETLRLGLRSDTMVAEGADLLAAQAGAADA